MPSSVTAHNVALNLATEKQVQYWDALIIAICAEHGVTQLYTEDAPSAPKLPKGSAFRLGDELKSPGSNTVPFRQIIRTHNIHPHRQITLAGRVAECKQLFQGQRFACDGKIKIGVELVEELSDIALSYRQKRLHTKFNNAIRKSTGLACIISHAVITRAHIPLPATDKSRARMRRRSHSEIPVHGAVDAPTAYRYRVCVNHICLSVDRLLAAYSSSFRATCRASAGV